jgi:hypothetical protein
MMFGFSASCWPAATSGSVGKNVPSVALRPGRPNWKSIVGVQAPKSAPPAAAVAFPAAAVAFAALTYIGTVDAEAVMAERRTRSVLEFIFC